MRYINGHETHRDGRRLPTTIEEQRVPTPAPVRLRWAILLGLLVRLILLMLPRVVDGDGWHNQNIALNLLHGEGFSHSQQDPYEADGQRAPLYALFLVPFFALPGPHLLYVYLGQCALDVGTALLLLSGVRPLAGPQVARSAAALYMLVPFPAAFCPLLLSTTLTIFVFTGWWCAVLAALRGSVPWAVTGLAAGAVCLATPALLPMVALAYLILLPRCVFPIGAAGCVALLLLAPWVARNYVVAGRATPFPVATAGQSLWRGLAIDEQPPLTDDGRDAFNTWLHQWDDVDLPLAHAVAADDALMSRALEWIAENPGGYVLHVCRQAWWLWARPGGAMQGVKVPRPVFNLICTTLESAQILLLAFAAVGAVRGRRTALVRVVLCLAALLTATYAPIHVETRYMLPLEPLLCVLATLALLGPLRADGAEAASTL